MKKKSFKNNLWRTSGKRIVLDNHSGEIFSEPSDKKLMTAEELTQGISVNEFMKRLMRD